MGERRSGRPSSILGLLGLTGLTAAVSAPSARAVPLSEEVPAEPKRAPEREPVLGKFKLHHSATGERRGSRDEQLQCHVDAQAKRLRKGARRLRDWTGDRA